MASKLRCPASRRGTVSRSSLIGRLAQDDSRPIVSVVAPSGYGKTTLLSQWAEHDGRATAWVSVDERDNDPKVLLSYVAEALEHGPAGRRAGVRGAGLAGQFGARLGGAAAGLGVLVNVHAGDADPR